MKKFIVFIISKLFSREKLVRWAFEIIEEKAVSKIGLKPLQTLIRGNYDRLKRLVGIYIDKNPNDNDQLKELVKNEELQFTDEFVEFAREYFVLKITDPERLAKFLRVLDKLDPIPNPTSTLEQ